MTKFAPGVAPYPPEQAMKSRLEAIPEIAEPKRRRSFLCVRLRLIRGNLPHMTACLNGRINSITPHNNTKYND